MLAGQSAFPAGVHFGGYELLSASLAFQKECGAMREHPLILDLDGTCLYAASFGDLESTHNALARS